MLHATLRENLDPEGICTDEQIWAALDKVGMKEAVEQLEIKSGKEKPAKAEKNDATVATTESEQQFDEKGKGRQTSSTSSTDSDKLGFIVEDSGSFSRGQVRYLLAIYLVTCSLPASETTALYGSRPSQKASNCHSG